MQGLAGSSPGPRGARSPWHMGGASCLHLDWGKLRRAKQCVQTEAGERRRSQAAVSLTNPVAPSMAMDTD